MIHHASALLDPHTCVLTVSQSGRSAEILQLLKIHAGQLLAVSNTADSPLAQAAHGLLLTRAGEEHTVSCKTYTATLAALEVTAEALLGRPIEARLAELWRALPKIEGYLSNWQRHVAEMKRLLEGVENVICAGRGASLAAALTAGDGFGEAVRAGLRGRRTHARVELPAGG